MLAFDLLIAMIVVGVLFRWGLLLAAAAYDVWHRRHHPLPQSLESWPKASVLIPAFNEARVIEGTVRSVLSSDYPDFEVIVADDGSTDNTGDVVKKMGEPRVRLLRLDPNGGKAAALNAALQSATGQVVVTVDADTVIRSDTLRLLIAPIDLDGHGPAAVSSNLKVGNRHRWLTIWQSLEYVTGLNIDRRAQAALGCITTVPGAASAFSRSALIEIGGYSSDTVTEDTDLTLALLRRGHAVVFQPCAWTFTESPDTFKALLAQRTRWLFGYLQCIYKHKGAFFAPSTLGWFGMPNLLFVHLLVYLLFPISTFYLARIPHWMSWSSFFVLVGAFFVVDLTTSLFAYFVNGDDKSELLHAPAQRFCWPFFLWLVFARVCWASLRVSSVPWKKLQRQGHLAQAVVSGQRPGIVR